MANVGLSYPTPQQCTLRCVYLIELRMCSIVEQCGTATTSRRQSRWFSGDLQLSDLVCAFVLSTRSSDYVVELRFNTNKLLLHLIWYPTKKARCKLPQLDCTVHRYNWRSSETACSDYGPVSRRTVLVQRTCIREEAASIRIERSYRERREKTKIGGTSRPRQARRFTSTIGEAATHYKTAK